LRRSPNSNRLCRHFEDPLFFRDNTTMIFGDAKKTLQEIVSEFKAA